jgi:uncharacterized DUF497 family protein
MLFEWDETKRQANLAKHLIDFADAVRIFDGPVFEKLQRRHGESRMLAVGLLAGYRDRGGLHDARKIPPNYFSQEG